MPGLLWDIRVAGVFRLPKVQRRVKAFFASAPVQPRRWHEPAAGPHQEPRTPRPPPGPEPPISAALPRPGHTQLVRAGEGRCPLLTMPYRDKKIGESVKRSPQEFQIGSGPAWFSARIGPLLEATGGFEPPNRGFADLRLSPLGYVAPTTASPWPVGAEGGI